MRVKIFSNADHLGLEKEINAWLYKNENMKIVTVSYSFSNGNIDYYSSYEAMIFYIRKDR